MFVLSTSVVLFQNCGKTNENLVTPSSQAEVMTAELVGKTLDKSVRDDELLTIAQARQKELIKTLRHNPSEVLRLGVNEEMRNKLAESVKPYVEKSQQVEGELLVAVAEEKQQSRIEYSLVQKSGERVALYLSRQALKELKTGQKIRARGLELVENADSDTEKKHLVVDPLDSGILLLAANGPSYGTTPGKLGNTYGEQKALIIRINFSDKVTQPLSTTTVQSIMSQVNTYYKEVSYNKTSFVWTTTNYFTIPATSAVCDTLVYGQQAAAAALTAGFNVNNYDRVLVAFPQNLNCPWSGLATVGGAPSYAWFNGVFDKHVVAHELGHNFGLHHAHSMSCGTTVLGDNCQIEEYGNPVDTMGPGGVIGHFNAHSKDLLGWLEPGLVTVTNSGSFNLAPYEYANAKPLALKILKGMNPTTGEKTYYYLEYRQATGQDLNALRISGRVTENTKGFMVHMGDELNGYNNYLLDMTPVTYYNFSDAALGVNKQYDDVAAGLSILTRSVSASGASVDVTLAPAACAKSAPEVTTATIGFSLVDFGSKILYNLKVVNKNSVSCANETFTLSTIVPSGFSAQLDQNSVTLASGQSVQMNLVISTPASGANATYSPIVEARAGTLVGSLQLPIGMTEMGGTPPAPTNDIANTLPGQPITFTMYQLTSNDIEPDGNAISIDNRMGVAQNGTVTFSAPQGIVLDVTYTPNPGFVGTDRFKYMIRDGTGYNVAEAVIMVGNATPTPAPSPSPTATPTPSPSPTGDTTPPVVTFTAPADGSTSRERGVLTMTANATDNVKVARVEFYVNGVLTCTDTLASYRCPTVLPAGVGITYRLEARAIDTNNNSSSKFVTITSSSR